LNAVPNVITKYEEATEEAYHYATKDVMKFGFANGTMMASFLLAYVPTILYGAFLIYEQVLDKGCDPSGSVGDESCSPDGENVFGALFGITFAGSVLPQITSSLEAFAGARSAAFPAIEAINRTIENDKGSNDSSKTERKALQRRDSSVPLPRYSIDATSTVGLQLKNSSGNIRFQDVKFAYPSRMEATIFNGFTLDIPAGKTVALVGSSGGGKSTVVQLIERFYDVDEGSISLDGMDIRTLNVKWLRSQIGLVSQEPKLFSGSIRSNVSSQQLEIVPCHTKLYCLPCFS
jgi:ATP-binding cassette subfamily B (MDR/TAP) protein 1